MEKQPDIMLTTVLAFVVVLMCSVEQQTVNALRVHVYGRQHYPRASSTERVISIFTPPTMSRYF